MASQIGVDGSLALDVVMSYGGLGLVRGRTRRISLRGMTVATGPIMLPLDAPLKVSFSLPQGGQDMICSADAVVVRHEDDQCVELQFSALDDRVSRRLRDLIDGVVRNPG